MRTIGIAVLAVLFASSAGAQANLQPMFDVQREFEQAVVEKGAGQAFLEFLSNDAILFRPEAVNGREFLRGRGYATAGVLSRRVTFADISVNGLMGYTTGEWTLTQKGRPDGETKIGQYATVWSKGPDGKYKAILDIEISHEPYERRPYYPSAPTSADRESNKKGWSAADASMEFLRLSMSKKGLGGAYDKFAREDVRLFREGSPPIIGRVAAEEELEMYKAVDFPAKVSQFQTSDMAYSWNQCSYATSNEGMEKGNCLHIWKFRDEKWKIVLGVFARVKNEQIPVLKDRGRKGTAKK
jgi:ketosteroid isomerase-like protein